MRHYLFPAVVLAIGLVSSQIIFSVVVYISNISLFQHLIAINNSGYLIIPNLFFMKTLREFTPAFLGAMFFSLTTGAGLTLLTFFLILLWRSFNNRKSILYLMLILWITLIININLRGINIPASVACLLIPMIVSFTTIRMIPKSDAPSLWIPVSIHCSALFLIFLSWFPYLNKDPFITFRDYLLLNSSIGQKINDFYYTYTMYPAEVFKPIDQKLLKTCHIEIENRKLFANVEEKLRQMDYLEVGSGIPVDLMVEEINSQLVFFHNKKIVIESTPKEFFADPERIMTQYAQQCDNNSFFRKITFLSLIIGLPIFFYLLLHAVFMLVLFFLPSNQIKFTLSSALCLICGIALTFPFYHYRLDSLPELEIVHRLHSNDWQSRTAALKKISDENIDIDRYINQFDYTGLHHIPEKYWFAKALSTSKSENTYKLLLGFLDDPSPNVVCMALFSLGKRNQGQAIDKIIHMIKEGKHWYIQWYAYKALKRMGWEQPKSIRFQ